MSDERLAKLRKDAEAGNGHDVQLEAFVAREVMWCFEEIDRLSTALAAAERKWKNARICLEHFKQSDVSIREFTIDLRRALDGLEISSGRSRSDD